MFTKLKTKWKVNNVQLFLIFCTFAIGGSLCGFVGRKILNSFCFDSKLLYYILYILLITILWPIAVLLVSIVLGQFPFFNNYVKKIGKRMLGKNEVKK